MNKLTIFLNSKEVNYDLKRYLSYGFFIILFMLWTVSITTVVQAEETVPIPTEPVTNIEKPTFDEPVQNNNIVDQTTIDNEIVIEESEAQEAANTADDTNIEVNNGIPVIYLDIDESRGTIDAMNYDPTHSTYCYGTMDFILPSPDFKYADLQTDLTEYHNSRNVHQGTRQFYLDGR